MLSFKIDMQKWNCARKLYRVIKTVIDYDKVHVDKCFIIDFTICTLQINNVRAKKKRETNKYNL